MMTHSLRYFPHSVLGACAFEQITGATTGESRPPGNRIAIRILWDDEMSDAPPAIEIGMTWGTFMDDIINPT